MDPARQYGSELNFLERYGLAFLRRWSDREPPTVRVWSAGAVAHIRRLERRAPGWPGCPASYPGVRASTPSRRRSLATRGPVSPWRRTASSTTTAPR
jgi:hypothetical protein